ncbi:MAG: DNA-formamidopyrimidine glycosylase [Atribacterota bacterium]
MPELPEVETIKRDLEKEILYKTITNIQVCLPRIIKYPGLTQFSSGLKGKFIKGVKRRGKYILCILDNDNYLIFHLGMSGVLFYQRKNENIPSRIKEKHNHILFFFEDGSKMIYNDIRQFGKIWLIYAYEKLPQIESLGWEPLEESFTFQEFFRLVQNKKGNIKSLLMNQKNIAGIGNIYASEILFLAGIHPLRKADSLTENELRKLFLSIRSTLNRAVLARGMTMEDESYFDLLGEPGNYREEVLIYGKKKGNCPICGHPLSVIRIENRSTYLCPNCQKN